jgi:hypothetical protein
MFIDVQALKQPETFFFFCAATQRGSWPPHS